MVNSKHPKTVEAKRQEELKKKSIAQLTEAFGSDSQLKQEVQELKDAIFLPVDQSKSEIKEILLNEQKEIELIKKNPLAYILTAIQTKHIGTDIELKTALTGLLYVLRCIATKERGGILQLNATSSAGKSNMVNTILSCFPDEWIKEVGDLSANSIKYLKWNNEKILYIKEAAGTEKTTEHLKLMDSGDGGFKALVTRGNPSDGFYVEEIEIPVKFIITTRAEGNFDSQLENRMLVLSVDETEYQTFLVLLHRCMDHAEHLKVKDFSLIKKFIKELKVYDKIILPYTYEFLEILDRKQIRVRRDIDKIFYLCETSAFLNQHNRPIVEKNGVSKIYATPEDAYNVFTLCFSSFEETISGLSKKLRMLYNSIPENKEESITYREIAKKIGWNKRTIMRAVEDQLDNKGLVKIDTSSQSHKISRAEPINTTLHDFNKHKKEILFYTAVELCKNNNECNIPISWHDINDKINRDTNRDKLGQNNNPYLKNRDTNRDITVTNFYKKDDFDEYLKNKDTITVYHFCHGLVTLNVTVSLEGQYALFKYCDTVTKGHRQNNIQPDIKLGFSMPPCHVVTVDKKFQNEKIKDLRDFIIREQKAKRNVYFESFKSKFSDNFILKCLQVGIIVKNPDESIVLGE